MRVRSKKLVNGKVMRVDCYGELKEVMINEDLLHMDKASIGLAFRGNGSSGIVELNTKEIDFLYEELKKRKNLFKEVKILKFSK
jgi:hypothetical protein